MAGRARCRRSAACAAERRRQTRQSGLRRAGSAAEAGRRRLEQHLVRARQTYAARDVALLRARRRYDRPEDAGETDAGCHRHDRERARARRIVARCGAEARYHG